MENIFDKPITANEKLKDLRCGLRKERVLEVKTWKRRPKYFTCHRPRGHSGAHQHINAGSKILHEWE